MVFAITLELLFRNSIFLLSYLVIFNDLYTSLVAGFKLNYQSGPFQVLSRIYVHHLHC